MSTNTIQSIHYINNQITVLFDQYWYQEDIHQLQQLLLCNIPNLPIKEEVIGADLEHVRFQWLNTEFVLHFECYSQSCWLDTQDTHQPTDINSLFTLLNQSER